MSALCSPAATAARANRSPNRRWARILITASRSRRESCRDSRGDRPSVGASATPSRADGPVVTGSASGQGRRFGTRTHASALPNKQTLCQRDRRRGSFEAANRPRTRGQIVPPEPAPTSCACGLPRGSRAHRSVTPRKQPIDCSDILPKGPQAVGQARRHRSRDRQMRIEPSPDELQRDPRAALNDQEKSRSIPMEAILGVPAGKLGFRPHARLAM